MLNNDEKVAIVQKAVTKCNNVIITEFWAEANRVYSFDQYMKVHIFTEMMKEMMKDSIDLVADITNVD
jgi:hypothetical protein